MPQLDFATFGPQLIWLVIVFTGLYLVMARVALPRIATVIEERRDRVADDLDQAAQFKQQTDDAIQAYETALAEARAKAHAVAQETRDKLHQETERQRQELDAELAKKIGEAEAKISATKDAALQNVRGIATDVAQSIVAHLLNDEADRSAMERAVDAELN